MASTKIVPKKSVQQGKVPEAGDLSSGEIAINYTDKKLYAKNPSSGLVVEIGGLSAHYHDQLFSVNRVSDFEVSDSGSVVVTNGSGVSTSLLPLSSVNRVLSLPDKNGTLATLDDVPASSTINDLDEMFNSARATYYHEVGYTAGGDVSAIEVYATSAKATHLYSRAFTYNASGNITQVLTTDRQNSGVSLTKTISYNGSGDIATMTRSYSL